MTDRSHIMAKLAQLENWTEQLGSYMENTSQAVADTRLQVEMLAKMLDASAERMLVQAQPVEAVMAYLNVRAHKAG